MIKVKEYQSTYIIGMAGFVSGVLYTLPLPGKLNMIPGLLFLFGIVIYMIIGATLDTPERKK